MRPHSLFAAALFALSPAVHALSVDELVEKNIEARGGAEALRAITSVKATGKMNFSGGDFSVELALVSLSERDGKVRTEASLQGAQRRA